MDSGDSDQFASADEGLEPASSITKRKTLVGTNLDTKDVNDADLERVSPASAAVRGENVSGDVHSHDTPKTVAGKENMNKKKNKKRSRQPQNKTTERQLVCQSGESDAINQPVPISSRSTEPITDITSPSDHKTLPEGCLVNFEKVSKDDVDREHDTIMALEPTVSPVEQTPESFEANFSGIFDPDVLSSATTSIIRNVGNRINSLAGVLYQVLSTTENDEDVAERRRRRKAEEEKDLKATLGALSDVWNATWGDNCEDAGDGWELEDTELPDEPQQLESPEKIEDEEGSLSKGDDIKESPGVGSSRKGKSMEPWSWAGVSSFAHNLTTSFQEKSLHLVQGSVNVLEKIGRKTMSVLEENDPGFRYTKQFIRPRGLHDQPSLSQAIHEARKQSEVLEGAGGAGKSMASQNRGNFNYQLEAGRGLVHLEALELVSYQAESRLHTHLAPALSLHDGPLETIWETLNFEDDDKMQKDGENESFLDDEIKRFNLDDVDPDGEEDSGLPLPKEDVHLWIIFQKILTQLKNVYSGQKLRNTLDSCLRNALTPKDENMTTQEQFFTAISTLAEMTSGTLEYLHKLIECLLTHTHEPDTDFLRISWQIRLLLLVNMKLKTKICAEYIGLVKKARIPPPSEETNGKLASTSHLIANILLEGGNAQSYLKNAARLLIPVLQLAYLTNQDEGGVEDESLR